MRAATPSLAIDDVADGTDVAELLSRPSVATRLGKLRGVTLYRLRDTIDGALLTTFEQAVVDPAKLIAYGPVDLLRDHGVAHAGRAYRLSAGGGLCNKKEKPGGERANEEAGWPCRNRCSHDPILRQDG